MIFSDNYVNKGNSFSSINFDLCKMIEDFDLYSFCEDAERHGVSDSNGASLVVTNKQYLMGYNAFHGAGTHIGAFARVLIDVFGDGSDLHNSVDAINLSRRLQASNITAKIVYENVQDNPFLRRKKFKGDIFFEFGKMYFTEEQYLTFYEFYKVYNNVFEKVCHDFNFKVTLSYANNLNHVSMHSSNNLDLVLAYIKGHIKKSDNTLNEHIIMEEKKVR